MQQTHTVGVGFNEGVKAELEVGVTLGFNDEGRVSSITSTGGVSIGGSASIIPFLGYQHAVTTGSKPIHLKLW